MCQGQKERSLTRNKSGTRNWGANTKFLAHTFVVGHDAPFSPSPLKAFQLSKRFSLPFPSCAGRAQPSRPSTLPPLRGTCVKLCSLGFGVLFQGCLDRAKMVVKTRSTGLRGGQASWYDRNRKRNEASSSLGFEFGLREKGKELLTVLY